MNSGFQSGPDFFQTQDNFEPYQFLASQFPNTAPEFSGQWQGVKVLPNEVQGVPVPTIPSLDSDVEMYLDFLVPDCEVEASELILVDANLPAVDDTAVVKIEGFDFDQTLDLISVHTASRGAAKAITEHLQMLLASSKHPITGITVDIIKSITKGYASWPMIRWNEGATTEKMAIFKAPDSTTPCSCLIHSGYERTFQLCTWKKSFMEWDVASMTDLRELFVAAQHAFALNSPDAAYLSPNKDT